MKTANKIYSILTLLSLLLIGIIVVSCRDNEPDSPQPVTINKGARIGDGPGTNVPMCPAGQAWNPALNKCAPKCPTGYAFDEEGACSPTTPPPVNLNINPASITWNTAQAKFVSIQNEPGITVYVTPGTLNGVVVGKSVMYRGGIATSESILFRIRPIINTNENNTDYFTPAGKFLGILKTKANQITGFTPTSNPPAPAERNCFSSCVLYNIDVLNQNAVLWLACVYWSPECAAIIAISCAAHCATH